MLKTIKSGVMIVVGGGLLAMAFGLIVLPQQFAAGGVTGLSVLLCKIIPLPISTVVLIINILLFSLGWWMVGREFALKTLAMSILFPVLLNVFQRLPVLANLAADPLLSSVLAGGMVGLGSGLILRGNGSSGGFDILGVILNKKFGIPVSLVMYLCDFTVILPQMLTGSLLKTAYGVVVILVTSLVVNRVLTYGTAEGQMLIFSQFYEEIRTDLLDCQDVGVTLLHGESGYLRKPVKVVLTVLPHEKIETVKRRVHQIDPSAFVLMNTVRYVGGRGYTISR